MKLAISRFAAALVLCITLAGCFFLPGTFTARLDLHRDGTFTYRYAGELAFAFPRQTDPAPWDPSRARCVKDKSAELRPCTPAEIEEQRARYIADRAMGEAQAAEFAAITGYNPYDKAANEDIARRMTGYQGWKQVTYKGDGVFEVVYEVSGRLDREMTFPVLPQAQLALPVLTIRPTNAGTIELDAPGLAPGRVRNMLLRINANQEDEDDLPLFDRANGTFTVTTDAQVVATNGQDQNLEGGKTIMWKVDGKLVDSPRLTIRLQK